jgi:hypothetical protein
MHIPQAASKITSKWRTVGWPTAHTCRTWTGMVYLAFVFGLFSRRDRGRQSASMTWGLSQSGSSAGRRDRRRRLVLW